MALTMEAVSTPQLIGSFMGITPFLKNVFFDIRMRNMGYSFDI
jgi:hypothetical protein